MPSLVFADGQGNIIDFPELEAAGMAGGNYRRPQLEDFIELPEGSEFFVLPDRLPVGIDPDSHEPLLLEDHPYEPGKRIQAVAAFMAPAHTAVLNSAYVTQPRAARLPLFAYSCVGWYGGKFWVTAFRSDPDIRQDCDQFNQDALQRKTKKKLKEESSNRLIQHLGKCCLTYGCPAARNYFLGRWEAPLPTSPQCNARCIGCISLQESGCCPSTQDRITFVPSPREISDMAIAHLQQAERAIVSFGQGCEGEPLLQAEVICEAIRLVRKATSRGTINLNSNASLPEAVSLLADAGLDSIRVSLNSVRSEQYHAYYRPKGYTFEDVKQSIRVMKEKGRFVSLNYFILPGFTDCWEEHEALHRFLEELGPDLIQLRNLNMDPEWYLDIVGHNPAQETLGMRPWLAALRSDFPRLRFGYFNPSLDPSLAP